MEGQQLFAEMALKAWHTQVSRADKVISALDNEDLGKPVAPGRNRVYYLLGHLVAVNDSMIGLFGLGERQYAQLDEDFVKSPDRAGLLEPDMETLREYWKKSNETLSRYFEQMSGADWFSKHTAMTDEDLQNDPGRNKLSVLLNRTNHLAYHLGQMILVK